MQHQLFPGSLPFKTCQPHPMVTGTNSLLSNLDYLHPHLYLHTHPTGFISLEISDTPIRDVGV